MSATVVTGLVKAFEPPLRPSVLVTGQHDEIALLLEAPGHPWMLKATGMRVSSGTNIRYLGRYTEDSSVCCDMVTFLTFDNLVDLVLTRAQPQRRVLQDPKGFEVSADAPAEKENRTSAGRLLGHQFVVLYAQSPDLPIGVSHHARGKLSATFEQNVMPFKCVSSLRLNCFLGIMDSASRAIGYVPRRWLESSEPLPGASRSESFSKRILDGRTEDISNGKSLGRQVSLWTTGSP
jgi:hypothetical protein